MKFELIKASSILSTYQIPHKKTTQVAYVLLLQYYILVAYYHIKWLSSLINKKNNTNWLVWEY
jgi:hypothetical protein